MTEGILMLGSLKEMVASSDLIVAGIGDEWNWVKNGLKKDTRYNRLLKYCEKDENAWLLPLVEYEYAYYNSDSRIEDAYKALRSLIGEKKYFVISDIFLQDALIYGFDADRCVYPCGNFMYLQTPDMEDELINAEKSAEFMHIISIIHDIINTDDGSFDESRVFVKPFSDGKELYLNQKRAEYSNIMYNENAYKENWDEYMKYLTQTLNSRLLILELGVGLNYPTVIRWPFEKMTFINKKAHLIRAHEKLYHHTPEIQEKTDSVPMNSVDYILQESKGL